MKFSKNIKRFLSCSIGLLNFYSPISYAEQWEQWVKVFDNEIATYYIDSKFIIEEDDFLWYTTLVNHKELTPFGYFSIILMKKGKCDNSSVMWVKSELYDELYDINTGPKGFPTFRKIRNPEWVYPDYGSPWDMALKEVCRKKK